MVVTRSGSVGVRPAAGQRRSEPPLLRIRHECVHGVAQLVLHRAVAGRHQRHHHRPELGIGEQLAGLLGSDQRVQQIVAGVGRGIDEVAGLTSDLACPNGETVVTPMQGYGQPCPCR